MNSLYSRYFKKLSFADSVKILDDLYESGSLSLDSINAICSLINLAKAKELNAKPIDDPFKLAGLFMGKNDIRPYLNAIYSDGETICASNGHILIRIKHQCEKGYYDALGHFLDDQALGRYPDVSRLIPTKNLVPVSEYAETVDRIIFTVNRQDHKFDKKYFKLIKKLKNPNLFIHVSPDSRHCLYVNGDNYECVIMPTRD